MVIEKNADLQKGRLEMVTIWVTKKGHFFLFKIYQKDNGLFKTEAITMQCGLYKNIAAQYMTAASQKMMEGTWNYTFERFSHYM